MTWQDIANQQGWSPAESAEYQKLGYTADQFGSAINAGLSVSGMVDASQKGISPDQYLYNAGAGPNPNPPEQTALSDMAKIDPTSAALRNQLGQSYLTNLQQSGTAPSQQQLQSYLDTYKAIDPTSFAGMTKLGTDFSGLTDAQKALVQSAQSKYDLGSTLDPSTQREVSQAARQAQVARGNVYGTPQLVAEAMQRGSAGEARQQQRFSNLATALQGQQGGESAYGSYLTSGATPGATALSMYQKQLDNQQVARSGAQGWLSSGQTPYQAATGYMTGAENAAASAAQAPSYQYNPQALGLGASFNNPNAGTQAAQTSDQFYNSMINQYGMTPQNKNRTGAAIGGAVSGGLAGIPLAGPTYGGSIIGGAIAGGLGGYMS